ncbi:MAG TPA: SDR family NAD(P)-dependent oxidoreductase [Acidimicrobiales bacterium]|nr:SDR family NAD(P)-dependent oxidoreductase [Acidimicrobiales bacterium]
MRRAPLVFEGATALVTGAGSGIGRATAHALADKGVSVLCTDIDGVAAEKTAAECSERSSAHSGAGHHAYELDVANRDTVHDVAQLVHRTHGPLHILVNNAGVGMTGAFSDMTADDWAFIRSINLDGVVHCCSEFTPPMLAARQGHVVNVSSGLGFTTTAGESAYGTTKAAVLQLSLCLRAEWASRGVGVTAICPGFINTPIAQSTRFTGGNEDPAQRARMVKGFARAHSPDKVGRAIVDGVAANRSMVPVGFESVLGWYAHRLMPISVQQVFGRLSGRR